MSTSTDTLQSFETPEGDALRLTLRPSEGAPGHVAFWYVRADVLGLLAEDSDRHFPGMPERYTSTAKGPQTLELVSDSGVTWMTRHARYPAQARALHRWLDEYVRHSALAAYSASRRS